RDRPTSNIYPYTTLFRSLSRNLRNGRLTKPRLCKFQGRTPQFLVFGYQTTQPRPARAIPLGYGIKYDDVLLQPFQMHRRDKFPADRKSTRLNSSHVKISY